MREYADASAGVNWQREETALAQSIIDTKSKLVTQNIELSGTSRSISAAESSEFVVILRNSAGQVVKESMAIKR
jgi:hypothetical protein